MEKIYTPEEVSTLINVEQKRVEEWLKKGLLKGNREGKVWQVWQCALEEFLAHFPTTLVAGCLRGFADGKGKEAKFYYPQGMAVGPDGHIYVADTFNHRIRRVNTAGEVMLIAGSSEKGCADGAALQARFNKPDGIVVDAAGNIYISDSSNHRIRKISTSGEVTTVAGKNRGYADGRVEQARFSQPAGLAIDSNGNLYIADSGNHCVRKISTAGEVTTIAGSTAGFLEGDALQAQFHNPEAVAVDREGNIYVADSGNRRVRKITVNGEVMTVAGSGSDVYNVDLDPLKIYFRKLSALALDRAGNLYIVDSGYNRIYRLNLSGEFSLVAGEVRKNYKESIGKNAWFNEPAGIALDAAGIIYLADCGNNRIRKILTPDILTAEPIPAKPEAPLLVSKSEVDPSALTVITLTRMKCTNVAVGPDGAVYVRSEQKLWKLSRGNKPLPVAGSPARTGRGNFYGMAVDKEGTLYHSFGYGLYKCTSVRNRGDYGEIVSVSDKVAGITVDEVGNIYFVDNGNRRIIKLSSSGEEIVLAGSGGRQRRARL
jgi:sugar lactone lactonase YvrE